MMLNMGVQKKLVVCLDICTRASRKIAVKSIFDMIADILSEEEDLLEYMIGHNAGNDKTEYVRHSISFLISAMACLDDVYLDCSPTLPEKMEEHDDEDLPF